MQSNFFVSNITKYIYVECIGKLSIKTLLRLLMDITNDQNYHAHHTWLIDLTKTKVLFKVADLTKIVEQYKKLGKISRDTKLKLYVTDELYKVIRNSAELSGYFNNEFSLKRV